MKRLALLTGLAVLAIGILGGCSSAAGPTGDAQMDKYNENREKAKKLGGGDEPAEEGDGAASGE